MSGAHTGGRLLRRFGMPPAPMLALTLATGVVDAVGYLHLDKVFAGNMTDNVVILGMAATGRTDLPVVGPLLALMFFLVGAARAGGSCAPPAPTGAAGARACCAASDWSWPQRHPAWL